MVDADRVHVRLQRLEVLVERLGEVRAGGFEAYERDEARRAATERWLQLAIQICIDLGAQVVAERSVPAPAGYAEVFRALAVDGALEAELAERLAAAARQRNVLVHAYLDVDDDAVFAALDRLDDLRAFARAVAALV